jgi:hypothetical protein
VFKGKGNMFLSDPWLPFLKQVPTEISQKAFRLAWNKFS